MKAAYYNEHDKFAAAWLRELITAGHIAPGEVDERSIVDVRAADLVGFRQCHFFAGIGGWSLALRLAGWPDDRAVWTGSCPCQPFSSAGAGVGGDDPRHLWPTWFRLIRECRPAVVFGEQVEAAIAHGWLDLVFDDLEGIDYAAGAIGLPAASVRAPHIRQRIWFVADRASGRRDTRTGPLAAGRAWHAELASDVHRAVDSVADTEHAERKSLDIRREDGCDRANQRRAEAHGESRARGEVRELADAGSERCRRERLRLLAGEPRQADVEVGWDREAGRMADGASRGLGEHGRASRDPRHADVSVPAGRMGDSERAGLERLGGHVRDGQEPGRLRADTSRPVAAPSEHCILVDANIDEPGNRELQRGGRQLQPASDAPVGFWDAIEWLACRDGKDRPVEPGTFPLAHGVPARVGRLRGYGNAIVPQVAAEVIAAYMEIATA